MSKLYRFKLQPDSQSCASCWRASEQAHPKETWEAAGIYPRSEKLLCGQNCHCEWEEVEGDEEIGDLSTIPLRGDTMSDHDHTHHIAPAGEQRATLSANGHMTESGEFEIFAITAGQGNGWNFSADALRKSVQLWNGAHCFIDHSWWNHSLRDLGGVCHGAEFDEGAQGVKMKLTTTGPSGPLVAAIGRELTADGENKPDVGFSADVTFTAQGNDVIDILKVYSLDLVYDPARGGAFIRALNQTGYPPKERTMSAPNSTTSPAPVAGSQLQAQAQADAEALRALLNENARLQEIKKEADAMREVRLQACGYLLDTGLAASGLPAVSQEHIRKQFGNVVFEAKQLNEAIQDQRALAAALTANAVVQGAGRFSAMYDSSDKLQAAVDDMLGAPRNPEHVQLKTHRMSGIREMYHQLTGDFDYHGGYYPDRVQFATTADFAGLVKNALNKIVVNQWEMLGREGYTWWEQLVPPESESHFDSLNSITGTLIGTVGTLPVVAEQGEYTELAVGDSPETASFVKYGGYIPLTLEMIDRDETRKLRAYPRELASSALRRISGLVAAVFTDNSGVGPTMADTGALFNSTAVTTAGGHANLLTTALGTTYTAWNAVALAVYNQPQLIKNATGYYGTGPKMAINPKFCLVPRALTDQARDLFIPRWSSVANVHSENLYKDVVLPVTVPEWTDATDWAAMCDPLIAPSIFVGDRFGRKPEIFIAGNELSPAVFMNDEHRIKVREFVAVWVNDFRPLHKENVAG